MKKIIFLKVVIGLILSLILFTPSITKAVVAIPEVIPYLDFGIDSIHSPARIWYDGGNTPLYGEGISVDYVTGVNTPLNSGIKLNIIGGTLNFQSGNLISYGPAYWEFGSGGTIELTGGLDLNNSGDIDLSEPSGTLLSGTFNTAVVGAIQMSPMLYFGVAIGSIEDNKSPALLDYYGLPKDLPYLGNFNIGFYGSGSPGPPEPFSSIYVLGGNIINTPIPIPTTFILLGSGLLGLLGIGRILRKKG